MADLVLIVDDDEAVQTMLYKVIRSNSLEAHTASSGEQALQMAKAKQYDLILMDVNMRGMDGFEVVRALRAAKVQTPVIMLTARDDVRDKIRGLDKGADDYMTKPFVPEELLARIRALSRRQGEVLLEEISMEDLTLSLSTNDLLCGAKSIHLAFKEFEIMKILLSNQKTIVSKEMLISKVWGDDSDAEDNNVEAYISFLRKKLSFLGSRVQISTIRKVGYRLESGNG